MTKCRTDILPLWPIGVKQAPKMIPNCLQSWIGINHCICNKTMVFEIFINYNSFATYMSYMLP